MTVELRPYQHDAMAAISASWQSGHRAPLVCMPTGAGKTVFFGAAAKRTSARNKRVLILAHRRELVRQASRKLTDTDVPHGIIAPGHTPTRDLVQVASVQTLARRLDTLPMFDLIVIDECHHSVAGQWDRVIKAQPRARLLGVTATPERLDARGLGVSAGGCFDDLIIGPSVAELTAMGFLVPARVYAPAEAPDLSGIRTKGGDFDGRTARRADERRHDHRRRAVALAAPRRRAAHHRILYLGSACPGCCGDFLRGWHPCGRRPRRAVVGTARCGNRADWKPARCRC